MDGITDHNLLITQEAAALLQPYMRHQSAMNWLVHDRQRSPVIPFILLQGDYYYRERDLVSFITQTLDAKARFIRINHLLHADHRNSPERRRKNERRKSKMITLQPVIERRKARNPDRRQSTDMDQRFHPS